MGDTDHAGDPQEEVQVLVFLSLAKFGCSFLQHFRSDSKKRDVG